MIIFSTVLLLLGADFPICTYDEKQISPTVFYTNDQYYVFWKDDRFDPVDSTKALFGSRVATDGSVLDPDGKLFFNDQVGSGANIDYDGTNFLGVFRNGC